MKNMSIESIISKTSEKASLVSFNPGPEMDEIGVVFKISGGIAVLKGLKNISVESIIKFENGKLGVAMNLENNEIYAAILDGANGISSGMKAFDTGTLLSVPVGSRLLGRVIDAIGRPLDGLGKIEADNYYFIERKAPEIFKREPVKVPLQTGILIIDSLIPIGRGQRELIIGDRQTGKTAIAVDTLINQKNTDVISIYCFIGRPADSVVKTIADIKKFGNFNNTICICAFGTDSAYMNFAAPYAATSIAEWFMENGRDVLLIYDDLTSHAKSYRELSLLLRRPPAREAYPGDIFFIHSRLLERATRLKKEYGGGSITALPIVETEAQNLSAYIPTNLVSITDGQIYLSPKLFSSGFLPAIDISKSVSRVGGNAQIKEYHAAAGNLKLSYSQYEELESFSRFGMKLDDKTRKIIDRGNIIKEMLKQSRYKPLSVFAQISILNAVNEGLLDEMDKEKLYKFKEIIYEINEKEKINDYAEIIRRIKGDA